MKIVGAQTHLPPVVCHRGRAPTATTPPASQSGNVVDISQSFRNFKVGLEKQEDAAVKKFNEELKSSS
jgi:hypothetical protein